MKNFLKILIENQIDQMKKEVIWLKKKGAKIQYNSKEDSYKVIGKENSNYLTHSVVVDLRKNYNDLKNKDNFSFEDYVIFMSRNNL